MADSVVVIPRKRTTVIDDKATARPESVDDSGNERNVKGTEEREKKLFSREQKVS